MLRLVLVAGACWLAYSIGRQRGNGGGGQLSGFRHDAGVDSEPERLQRGADSGAERATAPGGGVILTPDARV